MLKNKDTAKMFPLTPRVSTGRGKVLTIHGLLAARNKHTTVSGSRSLRGSLHYSETTGASDTRNLE